jgi:hypothetical protein
MDLFVFLQKLSPKGKILTHMVFRPPAPVRLLIRLARLLGKKMPGMLFYSGPDGRLRVSHRQLDPERSTDTLPYLSHAEEKMLHPGEIVPVEIPVLPTGMRFHRDEQLRLVVAGFDLKGPLLPDLPVATTCNRGEHVIHTGGKYDSHLLLPIFSGDS